MPSSDVKVNFTANASEFHAVARGVEEQIGDIKKALLGAVGIGAVSEMVSEAINFAKAANKSADELGTTLDRAIQLNHVMETIGKSGQDLVMSMGKVQTYMGKAYSDAEKMKKLRAFGITDDDFKDFNFDNVLRKALEATKTMSLTEAQQGLNAIFGRGMGADLLFKREQILGSPESSGINKEQVREILELTAKFKELKEELNILLLKALIPLGEWIMDLIGRKGNYGYYENAASELAAEVAGERSNKGLGEISDVKRYAAEAAFALSSANTATDTMYGSDAEKAAANSKFDEHLQTYVRRMAGNDDIFNSVWSNYIKNRPKTPAQEKAELAQRLEAAGHVPNEIQSIGGKSKREMLSNQFLQMGGLMGADLNYRLSALSERTANATERTALATEGILALMHTPSKETALPMVSPLQNFSLLTNGTGGHASTSGLPFYSGGGRNLINSATSPK